MPGQTKSGDEVDGIQPKTQPTSFRMSGDYVAVVVAAAVFVGSRSSQG